MQQTQKRHSPPGRIKIIRALRALLEEKNFSAITTSEIAGTAGVTEALIYKYFRDKRDLLYEVLRQHFSRLWDQVQLDLKGIEGALNKLRKIIWANLYIYANHKVFARIIILEVRNSPDYFQSEAHLLERKYNRMIMDIIQEGIENGEIRGDITPGFIRSAIHGSIENVSLQRIIYNRELSSEEITENICKIIFKGIAN